MIGKMKTSDLNSRSTYFSSTRSNTLFPQNLERDSLQNSTSFGTRSRLEIGTFNRVFTTSGSVRRQFADVFRFDLTSRRRLRIYLGNQFSNSRSSSRRMTVDLLNDSNLRRVSSMTVNPTQINAITPTLSPGTYRISISTQSNDRGRYFLDMVRL